MSSTFGLAQPWVLLTLLLLPMYGWLRWRLRRRDLHPYAPLQLRATGARGQRAATLQLAAEVLLLAVAVVALAGPHRTTTLELLEDPGIDVVLVLDVSLSMLAEDIPPNRLEALRRVARDFLHRSGSNRLGVVLFAGDVYVHSPLTTDHVVLRELLESVSVYALDQARSAGTALGDALLVAAERLATSKLEGRDQALIVITDGESNMGIEPELAARYVRQQDVRLYAVGVGGEEPVGVTFEGRPVGSKDQPYLAALDDRELRAVAAAADGRYFRAADVGMLDAVFGELSRFESAPLEVETVEIQRTYAHLLALLLAALFVLYLTLSGLVLRRPLR